jgi:hypothetical protein
MSGDAGYKIFGDGISVIMSVSINHAVYAALSLFPSSEKHLTMRPSLRG